jgi:hypothetical protein
MIARCCLLMGLLIAVGCTKPSPNPPLPPGTKTGTAVAGPTATIDPAAFAKEFVKAIHDGKATATQLTPQFKKVIAEPVFEADQALGFSDPAADKWLDNYIGKLANATLSAPTTDGDALMFTGTVPAEKPMQLTLRIVKSGSGWLVDWFFPAEVSPVSVPTLNAQSFAAAAFLEGLFGRKDILAAGMIAPSAKKYLAPPLGSEKSAFNKGRLGQKLAEYRGGFTGFTITNVTNDSVTGDAIKGDAKKPFTLKMVKGERPFEWMVDEIKID